MYLRGRVKNQHLHTPPTCGSTSGPLSTVSTVTYKKCASQQIGPTVSFIIPTNQPKMRKLVSQKHKAHISVSQIFFGGLPITTCWGHILIYSNFRAHLFRQKTQETLRLRQQGDHHAEETHEDHLFERCFSDLV